MEDGPLPCRAATLMDVNGMAHAPIWLQEVISKNDLVFLLELSTPGNREGTGNQPGLEKLRTADPRRMWRNLAEFR
jgi:hypothetical protein